MSGDIKLSNDFKKYILDVDYSDEIIEKSESEKLSEKSDIQKFAKVSGLEYINEIILKEFEGISDQYFFEYSIIGTTLDPKINKLYSFAGIKGNETFKGKIEAHVKKIILNKFEDPTNNFFHNPEFFIAPSDVNIFLIKDSILDIEEYKEPEKDVVINLYSQVDDASFYVSNMTYDRKFKDLLLWSKHIFENNNKNVNRLIEHYQQGLLTLKSNYDKYIPEKNEKYYYLSFPLLASRNKHVSSKYIDCFGADEMKNRIQGIGSCLIYFKCEEDDKLIEEKITTLYNTINNTVLLFSVNYIFNTGLKLQEDIRNESIKSAVAAIMSRNMSHNLGSHFISNTKNYFGNIAKNYDNKDIELAKDLRGVKYMLQYIQERMDFIATIVSGDSFPLGSVNFKAQIYDELNIDSKAQRHGGDAAQTSNFLLENIVLSEKITRRNRRNESSNNISLKLIVKFYNDEQLELFDGEIKGNTDEKLHLNNICFAIPGGILGRHAFFSIVENVIRNSAKHDKANLKDELILTMLIKDGGVYIFDNKENGVEKLSEIKGKISSLRILNEDNNEIDKSNKGLKEMVISALWLNNQTISKFFIGGNNMVLEEYFKVVAINENGIIYEEGKENTKRNYNLGYFFKLDRFEEHYAFVNSPKVEDIKNIKAEIIFATNDFEIDSKNNNRKLSTVYPRFNIINEWDLIKDEKNRITNNLIQKIVLIYYNEIITNNLFQGNFELFNKTKVLISKSELSDNDLPRVIYKDNGFTGNELKDAVSIVFKDHYKIEDNDKLKPGNEIFGIYENVDYLEPISGENYTTSIVQKDFLKDEMNVLRVIESALTSIVVIDERIFAKYHKEEKLQVVNFEDLKKEYDKNDVSNFRKYMTNNYKFLNDIGLSQLKNNNNQLKDWNEIKSIILPYQSLGNNDNSIIERALAKRKVFVYDIDVEKGKTELVSLSKEKIVIANSNKQIEQFINTENELRKSPLFISIHLSLLEKIKKENNNDLGYVEIINNIKSLFLYTNEKSFISIHSGRGNMSEDLEKELSSYSFMSLSALESCIENSKYFLTQLFYNTNYFGKGNSNKH